MNKHQIKIFISYAWENELHNNKVISFCEFLRDECGYIAEMDRLLSQQQSAIHFPEMMLKGITNSDKVIIVLSPKYKKKAESFDGGVGEEFRLIITDIPKSPNKYILISFDGIEDSFIPLSLKGRNIIDFSISYNEARNKLIAILENDLELEFSEVSEKTVSVNKKIIRNFEEILKEKNFEEKINNEDFLNSSQIDFLENEIIKATKIFQLVCRYKSEYIIRYNISERFNILGVDIFYNQDEFKEQLRITILENKGGWTVKKTLIIQNEETETYCSFQKEDFKVIDNHIFIVFETTSAGTFFNGMQTYNFCLFNLFDNSYEILKYFYISGNFVGEYMNVEEVSEDIQKIVFPLAVNFLENIGIGKENDIDENSFPHIEWVANNPAIYNNIRDIDNPHYGLRISFLNTDKSILPQLSDYYDDTEIYNSNIEITENENYIIYVGFVQMVVGFKKTTDEYFLIFVPEGYPAGGAWGMRSYKVIELTNDTLVISNSIHKLKIDLINGGLEVFEADMIDSHDMG